MELFEDALERVRLRYLFVVAGYVVMPEHVHLLVNEPARALLSRAMQALNCPSHLEAAKDLSGWRTIMTSTFPRTRSSWRNCATSIEIQ